MKNKFELVNRLFVVLILGCVFGCQAQDSMKLPSDIVGEIVRPQTYVLHKTSTQMKIDGKGDETVWKAAPYTDYFIDIEGLKIPKYQTRVKMVWDDRNLYIYAEMEEPHVAANITQHDTVIFYDKDFEVFIDPNDDTYRYYELEINANNVTWDLFLDRPYRAQGYALDEYEIAGLQTAVFIDGTLNDASDQDKGWSVEMAIPIASVKERFFEPIQLGDYWRINFSRVHWDQDFINGQYHRHRDAEDELKKEYNWVWSSQEVINMHEPEKWGYVFFGDETNESKFTIPSNHIDKQVAYACYRQMRSKPLRKFKKEAPGFSQVFSPIEIEGQTYQVQFHKTIVGYEFLVHNSSTGAKYVIDELGWLTEL